MLSKKWRERFTDDPNNRDRSNSLYPTLRRGVNLNPTLQIPESKTECWGIIGWCSQKHMQLREEKELIPVLFPRADARGRIVAEKDEATWQRMTRLHVRARVGQCRLKR